MNLHVRSLLIYIITMAGRLERGEKIFLFVYSELGYTKKNLLLNYLLSNQLFLYKYPHYVPSFFSIVLSQV